MSRIKGETNISNNEIDRIRNEFMEFKKKYSDFTDTFEEIVKMNDTRIGRREIGKCLRTSAYGSHEELKKLNESYSKEINELSIIINDAMKRESWGYKHLFYIFEMAIPYSDKGSNSVKINENVSKDILSKLFL